MILPTDMRSTQKRRGEKREIEGRKDGEIERRKGKEKIGKESFRRLGSIQFEPHSVSFLLSFLFFFPFTFWILEIRTEQESHENTTQGELKKKVNCITGKACD